MLYTEDFSMRHYVGFSQIGSHISILNSNPIHQNYVFLLASFFRRVKETNDITTLVGHLF